MTFALPLDYEPMEAKLVGELPEGPEWQYEPKWDGFRCLAFRDGAKVELQSKSGQALARYFPEVVEDLQKIRAKQFVLDSELVIPVDRALSFDELLQRIHPAASRVNKLAAQHPAIMIAFDLLAANPGKSLLNKTLEERRMELERFAKSCFRDAHRLRLSPATRDVRQAEAWFRSPGSDL